MLLTCGDSRVEVQGHSRLQKYDSLDTGKNCVGERNQAPHWQISISDNEFGRDYEDDWVIGIVYL